MQKKHLKLFGLTFIKIVKDSVKTEVFLFGFIKVYKSTQINKSLQILLQQYNKNLIQMYLNLNYNKNINYNANNINFNKPKQNTVALAIPYVNIFSNINKIFNSPSITPVKHINQLNTEFNYYALSNFKYHEGSLEVLQQANLYNKPTLLCEGGFLCNIHYHNLKKTQYGQFVSFLIDDLTLYCDTTKASRLELMLNDSNINISQENKAEAKRLINKIVSNYLSKYNNQPIIKPNIGRDNVKKILVIDQTIGDVAITLGGATEQTFKEMLDCAIKDNPNADIIVKTHPDVILGAVKGFYSNIKQHGNVYLYTQPINPIALLQYVDEVYVVTSHLGFEALMCNKKVNVFGKPFYAGWGLTNDKQTIERRYLTRNLEELFYITYILYAKYAIPTMPTQCYIEDAIDYLITLREDYFKENNITNIYNK